MSKLDPLRTRSPGERLRSADIQDLVDALAQALQSHDHQAESQRLSLHTFQDQAQLSVKDLDTTVLTVSGDPLSAGPAHEGATERIRTSLNTGFSSAGGELGGDLTVDGTLTVTGDLHVHGQLILGEVPISSASPPSGFKTWRATQATQLVPGPRVGEEGTGERLRRAQEQLVVSLEVETEHPSILLLRSSVRLSTYDNSEHGGYGEWGNLNSYFPAFGKVAMFALYGGVSLPLDTGKDGSSMTHGRVSNTRNLDTLLPDRARSGRSSMLEQWKGTLGWSFYHAANLYHRQSQCAFLEDIVVCGPGKLILELRAYAANTLITEGVLEAIGLPSELPP